MEPSTAPHSRIPSLDGLRAVSILLVVAAHFFAPLSHAAWEPIKYAFDGGIGVTVFFVISGYLITTLLLREEKRDGHISLSGFYWRRAFRILPALVFYWVSVLAIDLVHPRELATPSTYVAAATFTMGYWPDGVSWPLVHFWTLSMEEQFYLLWPLAFLLTRRRGRIAVCLLLVLFAPVGRALEYVVLDASFFMHLPSAGDTIMYGCLLALWLDARPGPVERPLFHAWYFRLAAVGLIWGVTALRMNRTFGAFTILFGLSCQSLAIAYLIASLTRRPEGILGGLLNSRALEWLGRISYSLYLWQQLFLFESDPVFGGWAASAFGRLSLVFVMATVSYYAIEQPMLRARARFLAKNSATNRRPDSLRRSPFESGAVPHGTNPPD